MVSERVMALDVGKVRVGVALSDPLGFTRRRPLADAMAQSRGRDMRSLLRLIRKHEVIKDLWWVIRCICRET